MILSSFTIIHPTGTSFSSIALYCSFKLVLNLSSFSALDSRNSPQISRLSPNCINAVTKEDIMLVANRLELQITYFLTNNN